MKRYRLNLAIKDRKIKKYVYLGHQMQQILAQLVANTSFDIFSPQVFVRLLIHIWFVNHGWRKRTREGAKDRTFSK